MANIVHAYQLNALYSLYPLVLMGNSIVLKLKQATIRNSQMTSGNTDSSPKGLKLTLSICISNKFTQDPGTTRSRATMKKSFVLISTLKNFLFSSLLPFYFCMSNNKYEYTFPSSVTPSENWISYSKENLLDLEASKVFMDKRLDKDDVVYPDNGIQLSCKKR